MSADRGPGADAGTRKNTEKVLAASFAFAAIASGQQVI